MRHRPGWGAVRGFLESWLVEHFKLGHYRISDQFGVLARLSPIPLQTIMMDLATQSLPESAMGPEAARAIVRAFAENLILATGEDEASKLLIQDRSGGRAFLAMCMLRFSNHERRAQLQEEFLEEEQALPFYDLAAWALEQLRQ